MLWAVLQPWTSSALPTSSPLCCSSSWTLGTSSSPSIPSTSTFFYLNISHGPRTWRLWSSSCWWSLSSPSFWNCWPWLVSKPVGGGFSSPTWSSSAFSWSASSCSSSFSESLPSSTSPSSPSRGSCWWCWGPGCRQVSLPLSPRRRFLAIPRPGPVQWTVSWPTSRPGTNKSWEQRTETCLPIKRPPVLLHKRSRKPVSSFNISIFILFVIVIVISS